MTPSDRSDQITPFSRRSTAPVSRLLTVLLVLPAAVLLLTPFGLVAAAAAEQPDMLMLLVEKPLVAVQLAAGFAVSLLFCALPFSPLVTRPVEARVVPVARKTPDAMPPDRALAA